MVYDDIQKKWVPSGSSSGLSKVQIYHHQQNNTFRVVGRKLQDHEVVINCSILKGLKYNQATATFHQWRDSKFVYGLNFSSQQDAEAFARAMMHALEVLSGRVIQASMPIPQNGQLGYDEDMGYRTMTREDAAMIQQQQINPAGPGSVQPHTPTSQQPPNQNIPQSPPTPQGHHRTSRYVFTFQSNILLLVSIFLQFKSFDFLRFAKILVLHRKHLQRQQIWFPNKHSTIRHSSNKLRPFIRLNCLKDHTDHIK